MPCREDGSLDLRRQIRGALGLLFALLLLLWSEKGWSGGDAVFNNKLVTSGSVRPRFLHDFEALLSGRGGKGERRFMVEICVAVSFSAGLGGEGVWKCGVSLLDQGPRSRRFYSGFSLKQWSSFFLSSPAGRGGEERRDDGAASLFNQHRHLPARCYAVASIRAHQRWSIDGLEPSHHRLFWLNGSREIQPPVGGSSGPCAGTRRQAETKWFVPGGFLVASGKDSTPEWRSKRAELLRSRHCLEVAGVWWRRPSGT